MPDARCPMPDASANLSEKCYNLPIPQIPLPQKRQNLEKA